jgi:hypothetical protein
MTQGELIMNTVFMEAEPKVSRQPPRIQKPAVSGRNATMAALVGILALAVGLRGYQLGLRSLWFDEAFTWRIARFPVPELFERVSQDNSPPLYYLLLKGWIAVFGTSVEGMRCLSILFSTLACVGMYLLCVEALRPRKTDVQGANGARGIRRASQLGLIAALLIAVNPFHIIHGGELRMYSLGDALAAFSGWALFRALHHTQPRVGPWLSYAVVTLAFAFTHYYALFQIAAQATFLARYFLVMHKGRLAGLCNDRNVCFAVLAGGLIGLGWLPWLPSFLAQRQQVQFDFWIPPLTYDEIRHTLWTLLVGPRNLDVANWPEPWHNLGFAVTLGVLGLAILCTKRAIGLFPWRTSARNQRGELKAAQSSAEGFTWYMVCGATVPVLLAVAISKHGRSIWCDRYLLFAHFHWLAALAVVLWRVPWSWCRVAGVALVFLVFLHLEIATVTKMDVVHRSGERGAAAHLAGSRVEGEPVVVSSPFIFLSMLYYLHASPDCRYFDGGKPFPHYVGTAALKPEDSITTAGLAAITTRRAWTVDAEGGAWALSVPAPAHWVMKGQERFQGHLWFLGWLVVTEYDTGN